MARSQYGLKKTFGPGIIQQQVYNDKAKSNKELVVSTIPDEVISFHLAPGAIPTAASLAVAFTSDADTYEPADQTLIFAFLRDYFELRGPRDVYRFALHTPDGPDVAGAIRVDIDSNEIDVMGNNLASAMNGLTFRDLSGVSYAITVAYVEGTDTLSITFPIEAGALGNNIEFIFNESTGDDVTLTFNPGGPGITAQHLSGGADAVDSMIRVGKGNIVRLRSTITSDLVIEFEDDESATAVHTDVSALALSNQHGLYLEKPSAETLDATFIADGEYMTIYHVGGSFSNTLYIRIEITEDE